MRSRKVVLSVFTSALLIPMSGCFNQASQNRLMEKAEAQVVQPAPTNSRATHKGWKTHAIAGLSISSPFPFVKANSRLDVGLRDLEMDVRSKIVSYESWDADSEDGRQKVVINRITYAKGTELNLDEAVSGTVEDIATGLDNACKPQYTSASEMISGLPGRRLSLSCNLSKEGMVYVESVIFSDRETLWQVQVAFEDAIVRSDATQVLQSVSLK